MPAKLQLDIKRNGTPPKLFQPLFKKAAREKFPGSKVHFHNDMAVLSIVQNIPAVFRDQAKELPGVTNVVWVN